MDGLTTNTSGMMTTDLQDLSSQAVSTNPSNPADVLTAGTTVSPEDAANALVNEKEDVQRALDSSGYLSVPTGSNDSNSQEASQQSFLSYLQDHASTGGNTATEVTLFNNAASQLAAAYPYIYNEGNSSYAPLTNSPLSSALATAQSSLGVPVSVPQQGGNSGQQFVSYNGDTYLIQTGPNGTHQLVAALNGRSMSPNQEMAETTANLVTLEKPFEDNDVSADSSSQHQLSISGPGNVQSYITRVSPSTIQWLIQNYETAEGVSLPRSTLYSHYQRHCTETKQEPVNAASFGKLIRSVFLGLRTRRIGTRGNSKYHYYGIRVKPTSILNQLNDDSSQGSHYNNGPTVQPFQHQQAGYKQIQLPVKKKPISPVVTTQNIKTDTTVQSSVMQPTTNNDSMANPAAGPIVAGTGNSQLKQYINNFDPKCISDFPCLPDLSILVMPGQHDHDDFNCGPTFEACYKQHCLTVVTAIGELNFSSVELIWKEFWSNTTMSLGAKDSCMIGHNKENQEVSSTSEEQKIKKKSFEISSDQLKTLFNSPIVHNFILEADYALYQYLVDILLPKVLKPIPNTLTQWIRTFSKNLENWMTLALQNVPEELKAIKINAVKSLAQMLRRYTGLNHLAQAARAVLQNSSQVSQMLNDLNKVDFTNVQEQASWVCRCDTSFVLNLENEFKSILGAPADLETWAEWLQSVVNIALASVSGTTTFTKAARQFLLKWSFYSSMIIRDLTLRSAASFGSFHLIRLLFDEYMFFLVEQKIAKELQQSPVAIMGMEQFKNANHADDGLDFGDDDEEMEPSPKQAKINTTVSRICY